MSFSSDIKRELLEYVNEAAHCDAAELAAILNCCGELAVKDGDALIKIRSDNYYACARAARLIYKLNGVYPEACVTKHAGRRHYALFLSGAGAADVLTETGLYTAGGGVIKDIAPAAMARGCCRRAYIRGAFIAAGFMYDPEKTYHIEFTGGDRRVMESLRGVVSSFSLKAKLTERKGGWVVYLKESGDITDLLNVMRAHRALLTLAGVRVYKDVANDTNRRVNFEAANIDKTISASVRQLEDINYIKSTVGLSYLNEQLASVAELRLKYPEASLVEIGSRLGEPVSKSGVNHRFNKISETADNIRRGEHR